jgi:hypothetical protein
VDRNGAGVAVGALLAPAGHQQQRVVDRHAEPDQRDQVLHDQVHVGHDGEQADQQERRQDGDGGDQQRGKRQQRAEHEHQHG